MKKKISIEIYPIIIMVVSLTLANGCSKEKVKEAPIVRTSEVSQITEYSAICGGIVTLEGDAPVFERGICWDSIQDFNEIKSPHSKSGEGFGDYISYMYTLHDNTKYYVRAYAINNYGTGYGEIKTFTTLKKADELGRDQLIGEWQFIESFKSTKGQSYKVNISKDPNLKNGVILGNFGNPGSNDIIAKGIVTSTQLVVSSQKMSNNWIVDGTGKFSNSNKTAMNWTFSVTAGGSKDTYTATATKL